MKRLLLLLIVLFLFVPEAVSGPRKIRESDIPERQRINDVYVVHFVLDGLNKKAFDRALADNRLPTIKQNFVDGGASFSNALSLFPSTSTTVYQSYVTGLLSGNSGIPHLERFDREGREVVDYLSTHSHKKINTDLFNLRALLNPNVTEIHPPTTIFELLDGYETAAIYSPFYRGATMVYPKIAPIAALWSTYVTNNKEHVNILAMKRAMDLFGGNATKIPRYTIMGLYSTDILGHEFGPQSSEVQDVLTQFDFFLRDFIVLLDKQGIQDKTYIIISADHGMHDSGELFDFQKALEERGIAAKTKNPKDKNYTLYAASRGVASSHIYVKHKDRFEPLTDASYLRTFPTSEGNAVDLIDFILKLDATDILAVRSGERRVKVFGKDGKSADIICNTVYRTDYCSYKFDAVTGDPLEFSGNPALKHVLDGKAHSSHVWLAALANERYPDAVVQLSQIFHDGRGGDAFISTRNRFGFRKVKAGNHGGAGEDDMRVPLVIMGPAVPRGKFGIARACDIYPLVVEWFGLAVDEENYDGKNPFEVHYKDDPSLQKLADLDQLMEESGPLLRMVGVEGFIKDKVYKIAKPAEFHRLRVIAEEESLRRSALSNKLTNLLKSLESQKNDRDAPEITSPAYLSDHLAIVKRAKKAAVSSVQRMDDLISILSNCTTIYSSGCGQL